MKHPASEHRPENDPPDHTLLDHSGIVAVHPDWTRGKLEIDFDPAKLSEQDIREIVSDHQEQVTPIILKSIYRLEGSACEACALKLEKRVSHIPGVRRATASYIGKVMAVTFDSQSATEAELSESIAHIGANISPYTTTPPGQKTFWKKIFNGDLNDEISCTLGLVFLISAALTERTLGSDLPAQVLYAAAYFFAGQEGVRSAIASLREKVLDVDVLMVLAAIGAAIIGQPFEGALLLFLFSFSNVLQRHAMDRTRKAIESLLTLRPSEALVKRPHGNIKVPVEELAPGDTVIVRPGEQIPVDGELCEGTTHVDESSLTGESMPVAKSPGSQLFAGTLNQSGGVELRVTKRAEDSTLSRMVKLVAEAQAEKSHTQRFLEKAEQSYALGVIVLTTLVFLIPFLFAGEAFSPAFYRAMTVMVVASPCALVISTPATVLSAIGGAARIGILIKGGSHLERAAKINIVAIDKTGTLTLGKPSLTAIVTTHGLHPLTQPLPPAASTLLQAAAALESKSEHPLAHAIVTAAQAHGLSLSPASDFQSTPGKGAQASLGNTRYLIGSERMFQELNSSGLAQLAEHSHPLQQQGKTCVWLGTRENGNVTAHAVFVMADTIRPAARTLTADLHRLGVEKVVMLTGDQPRVAHAIAAETNVDEVHAGLLPQHKLAIIRQLKTQGTVMMIGDGVNDAPALAIADIGVAMGAAGTDVAMETADIILMADRLENIPVILAHSRKAKQILIQNLAFASGVILILIIAALGFSLALPLGVIGHEGSTVLVCLNGLRLLIVGRQPVQS